MPAHPFRHPDEIGTVPFRGYHTWYRVNGDRTARDQAPLVVLHGGPGTAHNYCLEMARLAGSRRAVILYDQLGCGSSTHLPDMPPGFWNVSLFLDELDNLLDRLDLRSGYHLLGQSWGGMLASEFAVRRPPGLRSLVLANSPASMPVWRAETARLVGALEPEHAEALRCGEATGHFDSAAYRAATLAFYGRHVCRLNPMPDEVAYSFAQIDADPTVYHAMNGPTEFAVVGSLREWSIVDRLCEIAVPTLVVAGAYDEATEPTWRPFVESVPDVRAHVFPASSHMPHVEEPEAFVQVVGDFLAAHDGRD